MSEFDDFREAQKDLANALNDERDDLRARLAVAEAKIFELMWDNASLSARACPVKGELVGDDHGHSFCRLQSRLAEAKRDVIESTMLGLNELVDSLQSRLDRLIEGVETLIDDIVDEEESGTCKWVSSTYVLKRLRALIEEGK